MRCRRPVRPCHRHGPGRQPRRPGTHPGDDRTGPGRRLGKLLLGGGVPGGDLADGFYVEPTVFGDVDPDSELGQVEVFGPVLSLMRFNTEDEALAIANGDRLRARFLRVDQRRRPHQPAGHAAGSRRRVHQRRHARSSAASCRSAASASPVSVAKAASKDSSNSCERKR